MTAFSVKISVAEFADAEVIVDLSRKTFFETFASKNTKEDMDKYLDEKFNLGIVKTELNDAKTVFFLASIDEKVIGYSKSKQSKIPKEINDKALEIERLYVCKDHQNKKIGAILIQENIHHAIKNALDTIWLGVWEHNPKAIEFYERWGFEVFDKHVFVLGNDPQNDLLMKREVKNEKK